MPGSSITICTFKWGSKYKPEHVARLRSMLARNLTIDWEFALISDDPADEAISMAQGHPDLPGSRWIPLWDDMRDTKYCGVRLRAFGADMVERIAPRFAWIDMDVVITGNVDHIFSRQESFVGLATPRPPMPYNGSLVMMDAGARTEVLAHWTPEEYARTRDYWAELGVHAGAESDEGWMGRVLGPDEARITREDGVRYFKHDGMRYVSKLSEDVRMVIMNGRKYDPSDSKWQKMCPWIQEHWR